MNRLQHFKPCENRCNQITKKRDRRLNIAPAPGPCAGRIAFFYTCPKICFTIQITISWFADTMFKRKRLRIVEINLLTSAYNEKRHPFYNSHCCSLLFLLTLLSCVRLCFLDKFNFLNITNFTFTALLFNMYYLLKC